jgi:hypothetical protein
MKRAVLITLCGIAAGLAAHAGWFALRRPPSDLETQLAWMNSVLQLSPDQFARFKAVHEEASSQLVGLATELQRIGAESAAFERRREETGEVDFLAFARLVEHQRAVDRDRDATARRLIETAVSVMTPEQRQRYLALIAPALSPSSGDRIFH